MPDALRCAVLGMAHDHLWSNLKDLEALPGAELCAGADFNPVRWYQPPIDPSWTPRSAYKQSGDVTQFNPAHWYRPPINPIWRPRNGFGPTRWFKSFLD